jgi:hypothetical protein
MKMLFQSEWVKVRPHFNRSIRVDGRCALCGRYSMHWGWYSIKSTEFRCVRCFDPTN